MIKILAVPLSLCIFLSGCSTVNFEQMEQGLSSLVGKDKALVFQILGYPDQEKTFDKTKVYTWANSYTGIATHSTPKTTYGTIGKTPFSSTTTQTSSVPVEYQCKIQLGSNNNGIITNYHYDGDISGCSRYIESLNKYFNPLGQ